MNDELKQRLRSCSTLPTLPAVALKIIDLANDPDADIGKVCQLISLDPALAAKILKTANSPLYKSRCIASNIRQAIIILGTHAAIVIALSFSLAASLMKQPGQHNHAVNNNRFWRHSIASALACRALGEETKTRIVADDLFLAGLLQNIGMLAFATMVPEKYGSIIASASNHDNLLKIERDLLDIGHDELGYTLLKKWNIPDYICTACLNSHSRPTPKKISINININSYVAVSNYIADYFLDPQDTEQLVKLTEAAKSWLYLDNKALMNVIDIMAVCLPSVENLFEIKIHSPKDIDAILSEAKELLTTQALREIRELKEKTQYDELTGTYNRRYFNEALLREFSFSTHHKSPLTIAMIDLDNFKDVNNNYGHQAGDALLVMTARTILDIIRKNDTLSRYRGEEFALILSGTTLIDAKKLLLRLKDNISAMTHLLDNGQSVSITASIGVASNVDNETIFDNPNDLVKAADIALYAAKHAGRNKVVEWNKCLPEK